MIKSICFIYFHKINTPCCNLAYLRKMIAQAKPGMFLTLYTFHLALKNKHFLGIKVSFLNILSRRLIDRL